LADAVVAVETEPMASDAQTRLLSHSIDNVAVIAGPLAKGCAKHGPYDAVIIQGGVEAISPEIHQQIKEGGRIAAIFMDGPLGVVKIGYKSGQEISWRSIFNASMPVLADFAVKKDFAL
jgi:protein-L-isoaspartate(D-aspartate) O-methyltransferase